MAKKKHLLLWVGLLGAGSSIGAALTAKYYEKRLVSGEVILQNVRRLFTVVGTIEGSWIEMEPVFLEKDSYTGYVYYGGVTRKEEGDALVQYEFYADAKTGAILDLYRMD